MTVPRTARGFHELTVDRVRPQTADGRAIRFAVPDHLADAFRFVPGQYLTLRAEIDGHDVRRSYSICAPEHAAPEIGIKRVEGGAFSTFAMGLAPGDTVEVMPPQGRFTAAPDAARNLLLVAAGSGITPCLSIAASTLAAGGRATLVYGNRATATVMFREEVDALKDRHTDRFQLFHVTSREPQDVAFLHGRVDGERIHALAERGLLAVETFDAAYLCGPEGMIESVSKALVAHGMAQDAVRFELFGSFTSGRDGSKRDGPERNEPGHEGPKREARPDATIAFLIDGSRRDVPIDLAAQTALEAGRAAGLDLPFSCAGGMCCTCRAKVVEGEVTMDANYSLEPWELEQGYALACQARPKGDGVVMDFDAA